MKKNIVHIMMALLIIGQIMTFFKINNLQRQLDNTRNDMINLNSNIRNDISTIYSNVTTMLQQEASLIEKASTVIGTPDVDNLTAPITFNILPKEVSDNTIIYLDIDGVMLLMDKRDTSFTTTISRDIFSNALLPTIMIDESGIKKTTHDERINIGNIKDSVLPIMYPRLVGETHYGNGTYKQKGNLSLDIKGTPSGISFTEVRLVIDVDNAIISDEIIPNETTNMPIDKTISLRSEQVYTMKVIATDSIGLEHHYVVDRWIRATTFPREPWFFDEEIYSADGALLWKPEYIRID